MTYSIGIGDVDRRLKSSVTVLVVFMELITTDGMLRGADSQALCVAAKTGCRLAAIGQQAQIQLRRPKARGQT